MKPYVMSIPLVIVALAQPVLGAEVAPDARALGVTEAILAYCAKVDPSGATQYQERVKMVAQGANEETLAKVRQTEEYQKAHASMDDFVAKVDEHNSKRVCAESLAQKR